MEANMNYYEHLNSIKNYVENGTISFKEFEIEILDAINESTFTKRDQKEYINKFIEENGICFSEDLKYIIEINTFKKKDTGKMNIAIGVFGDGFSFGEMALIKRTTRNATTVTNQESLFLTIGKKDYNFAIKELHNKILIKDIDKFRFSNFSNFFKRINFRNFK